MKHCQPEPQFFHLEKLSSHSRHLHLCVPLQNQYSNTVHKQQCTLTHFLLPIRPPKPKSAELSNEKAVEYILPPRPHTRPPQRRLLLY